MRITAGLCLLSAIGVIIYSRSTRNLPGVCALLIAGALLVATWNAYLPMFRSASSAFTIGGATLVVLLVLLHCLVPQVAELESSKRLLQLADARGYSQAVVYGMQRSDRTPEFYAAGRIVYGGDGEPIMYESPAQPIDESRRRAEAVLSFVPLTEVNQLTATPSAQVDVIGNNGRYAIVAVRAR